MIDPADKQTQALPLDEQPAKKRRGRPATGKAMTPAEKQRAYRERMKNKPPLPGEERAREALHRQVIELRQELMQAKDTIKKLKTDNDGCRDLLKHTKYLLEEKRKIAGKFAGELTEMKKGNVTKTKRHRDDAPLEKIASVLSELSKSSDRLRYASAVGRILAILDDRGIITPE